MNRNFKSPQNQNDHMSNEDDGNKSKSANRHRFRAFFISSDGSWEIKESVQKGYLRDITGISEIVINRNNNLCDSPFVNQNIMNETKNYHKTETSIEQVVNKLKQTDQSLSISSTPDSYVIFSPGEKKGVSGSFKGKKHSEINSSKISPDKSVTKFSFKDFTSEFDPSQDIFESSIRNEYEYDEFSSETKGEKIQQTNNDPENTFRKEVKMRLKKKKKKRKMNTHNEARKFNNIKLNYFENMNKDKLYHPPQKRQNVDDIVAENLSMLEEIFISETTDETIVEAVEHMEAKLKSNTCPQEKKPLSKNSEHTTYSNCNLANTNNTTALNRDGLMTVSKEIEGKMYGKDSNAGDLNFKIRKDQVAKIESTNEKKQNSSSNTIDNEGELYLFEKSQEQRKRKKTMSTSVNTKLETNRMVSIGNSNKHKINLKTNYGQQMKGNVRVESFKKQTHIITTNTPSEVDESQKQKDEKNTCNTNPNITLGKDYINCKVTKSHRKETSKNNMKNIKVDYSPGKFPYKTDLKAEENRSPRKKKKHKGNKLKNSITGVEEHLTEEVQDGNDIRFGNILTDLKTSENVTPRLRKQHSQYKEENNTGLDVDEQSCEESQIGNDIHIENALTNLKTSENVTPRKRKIHSQDKEQNNTGIDVDEKSCEESQDGNDMRIANLLTDLKTSENVTPSKIKEHSQDEEGNNTVIDVDEQSSEESQVGNDISIENVLTDLKSCEDVTPRKRKKHSQDNEKNNTGIDVDEKSCKESQDMFGDDEPNYDIHSNMKVDYVSISFRKEIQEKKDKKDVGDLNPEMRIIDQVTQIESTKIKKQNSNSNINGNVGEKISTNANTKFEIDSIISFENSNKHEMKLKTNSSQEMKGNSPIDMSEKKTDVTTNTPKKQSDVITTDTPEKQTDDTATNTLTENDESQEQIDEKNTCNTNLNIQLGKDINCKVSKRHSKEIFKNNVKDFKGDSLTGKFLYETDITAEEHSSPRKTKKHNKNKLKNNSIGEGEHLSVEVQDGNGTYVDNLVTDFKTRDNFKPRKGKKHCQDKSKDNTGIDVDGQSVCIEVQTIFGNDTRTNNLCFNMEEDCVRPKKRKEHKNNKLKNNISIDSLSNKYKTGRESRHENPGDFSSNSSNLNEDLYNFNSETELSSNLSITYAKKLKKHKKEIAKMSNFDRKSSLNYPDAKKDASSSKKHKKSDDVSPKGYSRKHNKPCPGSALVSGEQENSDTNDSEWKCADESCTDESSSSENEANKKIRKKLITKTKAQSKEQSDILNENKALLVSSTPFPVRKKGKERFSELRENSSRSFYNTSENINNDNSTPANQTILEEIQCKMIASESEIKSLKKLKIEVDWELSPLHKIDTGSGKVNTSKLRTKLGSKHLQLLDESKFTDEDENKIKQSWEEFAQMYNFNNPELFFPSAQNFGCFSYAERHNFKLFLAKYLPNRRLLSVYLKFVNMYGVKKKGRWSDKEDRLLLDLYNACTGDNASDGDSKEESQRQPKLGLPMKKIMSKALDRTMTSVIARLNILLQNENAKSLSQKDIDWTPELEGAVIHRLLKKSKVDSLEDLRHLTISYKVWRKVVTKLGLPFDKVVNHWKYFLYPQLFAHQPVLRHLLQMELIKWFYNSDIKDLKSVDWNDLSRRSGDLGSCYLYRVFNSLIQNYVPKNFRKNFRESVIFLHEQYLPKLKEKTTSHMLIRKFYDPHTRTLNYRTEDEEDCIPFRIE